MRVPPCNCPFSKYQSVGNDFVIVDIRHWPDNMDWSATAVLLCDRHTGAGADGLLTIGDALDADFAFRMFNPDGTEDMCGNGLRCVMRYCRDQNLVGPTVRVHTLDGIKTVTEASGSGVITADMGRPHLAPAQLPMDVPGDVPGDGPVVAYPLVVDGETLLISVVSLGTTHTVIFVPELPEDERFFRLSPLVEHHPLFPERTSIMWATTDGWLATENVPHVTLRIWERGVGETLGCGTGACAAAVAAILNRRMEPGRVLVLSKGGELAIEWQGGESAVQMSGIAHQVYEGRV